MLHKCKFQLYSDSESIQTSSDYVQTPDLGPMWSTFRGNYSLRSFRIWFDMLYRTDLEIFHPSSLQNLSSPVRLDEQNVSSGWATQEHAQLSLSHSWIVLAVHLESLSC